MILVLSNKVLKSNYISVFQLDVKFLESEIFKEEKLSFVS